VSVEANGRGGARERGGPDWVGVAGESEGGTAMHARTHANVHSTGLSPLSLTPPLNLSDFRERTKEMINDAHCDERCVLQKDHFFVIINALQA